MKLGKIQVSCVGNMVLKSINNHLWYKLGSKTLSCIEGDIFMDSIWTKTVNLPQFPALEGDIKTDVLIIGGGMAGILCAHFLQEQGVDYVLAEGRTICSGVTKNTTAKITSQHGLIYQKLRKSVGSELAAMYLDANEAAVRKYAELAKTIDCDFERKTNYVYSLNDGRKLEKEAESLDALGFHSVFTEETKLPFQVAGAIGFENQAQFHPLKFVAELAKNLRIYEHTYVKELKPHMAVTGHGNIHFQKVIFATHFPVDNKHRMYFLKMYQHRSYVIGYENAPNVEGMYVDETMNGMSFRNYGDLLFVGGGDHRTGKKGGNWREIREFVRVHYPEAREVAHWATQDCMSLDEVPYIGQYSKRLPECYVATGFNKWGMTSAMVAGQILADLVQGKENKYEAVFNPSRSMRKTQFLVNGAEAVMNLVMPAKRRCPHMGCGLKWNEQEHSWDCPCHGSRFGEDGGVIEGPATGDLGK